MTFLSFKQRKSAGLIRDMQVAAKLRYMTQMRFLGVFKPHEVNFDATGNSFNYSNTSGRKERGGEHIKILFPIIYGSSLV
ncbi:Uncharacterised protein [Corynebacterium ulcerans]|uniref:Transposase n=1 Tax=Corynebacterium ulcerans TaxID=65058 RepID=A0ABD7MUD3_CORUL|nr:Uncharacterised protein [Corynebacterium ulcerans]SQG51394.1 Uncharacterised protein [Corynebacterium ulcerans]SQH02381.1 Uncharacterised protein [Corynebacterium ulcerans]